MKPQYRVNILKAITNRLIWKNVWHSKMSSIHFNPIVNAWKTLIWSTT